MRQCFWALTGILKTQSWQNLPPLHIVYNAFSALKFSFKYMDRRHHHRPFLQSVFYIKNIGAFAYPQLDSEKVDPVKTCFGKLSIKFDNIIDKVTVAHKNTA
jgi:hypothetical protein